MTLDKQIRIGFITMLLIIMFVSGFSIFSLSELKHSKSKIGDKEYTLTEIIKGITNPDTKKLENIFEKENLFGVIRNADAQIGIAYSNVFIVAAAAVIFGGIIALMFPRRVTRPIMNLVEATESVREGDYSYRVKKIEGTDEIATLVNSFNKMLNTIEEEHIELEDRNAELQEMNALNTKLLEETRNFNRVLEEKVREVKEDLDQKHRELLKAEKLATIGEIATKIAHEIRNPLSGIAVALENLRGEICFTANNERVSEIISEVNRLDNIIRELFQLAIPRELSLVESDPNELAERVVSLVGPQAAQKSVEIEKNPAGTSREIRLDFEMIQQVIMNLMLNAIESINEPGGRIAIKSYYTGDTYVIEISDNGSGIPEKHMNMIFEPFFSTKSKGTGLGLAISRKIINLHNGSIRVESKEGSGTKFIISLPTNLGEAGKSI